MKFMDLVERNKQRAHEERMIRQKNYGLKLALMGLAAVVAKRELNHRKNSCSG